MKLKRSHIKKIIRESLLREMGPAFPVEILDDMDYFEERNLDPMEGFKITAEKRLGDLSLAKMIMRYLDPHKDKLKLDIFWSGDRITVSFSYDNTEIGETSAIKYSTLAGDTFFVVTWGGTFEGKRENVKNKPMYNHIDKVFKDQGGYGPITYEIAIEYLSLYNMGLTADREAVSDDAYDLWDYYDDSREDVQKRTIDFDESTTGYGQHNPTIISSHKWFEISTGKHASKIDMQYSDHPDTQPELTDDQLRDQFIKYLKNDSPLMKVYTKNMQPFLQAVRDLGILYVNNQHVRQGQDIK